ncbi:MAG TPA: oligosaccharide flippase family protein [Novosphingobium sp.]|nr:oligosaccharide flippase family protein [Novosphingobium sp.]
MKTPLAQSPADIAALAKGGRTNFFGFLLRLAARLPFLFIAGRLYGTESLGRFASAVVAVEIAAQLATLGQKRGLAQLLQREERAPECIVADALLVSLAASAVLAVTLWLLPGLMYPSGIAEPVERLLPLVIFPIAAGDVALAALAFRYDIATTVRARSVVEPWMLSIAAGTLWFVAPHIGLVIAYFLSIVAAMAVALYATLKSYGFPRGWSPHPLVLARQAWANLPIAGADMVESATRKIDILLLGAFTSPAVVGVYWAAQQIASLPQKLKTSFEPILGPVITGSLKHRDYAAIARQVCQVGFWITAAQAGIALALGIPGEAVMGLVGRDFVGGTGALGFLLAAEVAAATAVVSEAALIYVAKLRNLAISLVSIGLQAVLTVLLIDLVEANHLPPLYKAAAAALALFLALTFASVVKAILLARVLERGINNWRWALVWAAAPAVLVGWAATRLPEWAELAFGIPAILLTYGLVIWRKGFGPEDRVLFRRQAKEKGAPEIPEVPI